MQNWGKFEDTYKNKMISFRSQHIYQNVLNRLNKK